MAFQIFQTRPSISAWFFHRLLLMKTFLSFTFAAVALSSCMHVREKVQTYRPAGSQGVGQATVSIELQPQEAEGALSLSAMVVGAARATLVGPWHLYVVAQSPTGQCKQLVINNLSMRSSRGIASQVPTSYLGEIRPFAVSRKKGVEQAAWKCPGQVEADFAKDTSITVDADVTIQPATGSAVRKRLSFVCTAAELKNNQTVFVPTEVIQNFGSQDIPEDQYDVGVNKNGG
jgi:hypothetical protein